MRIEGSACAARFRAVCGLNAASLDARLGAPAEVREAAGCLFRVHRGRGAPRPAPRKVVALSLWVGGEAYARRLAGALAWWGRSFRAVGWGADWAVRIYVDAWTAARAFAADSAFPWAPFFAELLRAPWIELWLFDCPAGYARRAIGLPAAHAGTFGSLLRLHAAADTDVEVAVLRNVELLSSQEDAATVEMWLADTRPRVALSRMLVYDFPYAGTQHYIARQDEWKRLASRGRVRGDTRPVGVIGFFGAGLVVTRRLPGDAPLLAWRDVMRTARDYVGATFPYGVDEYVLTRLLWMVPRAYDPKTFVATVPMGPPLGELSGFNSPEGLYGSVEPFASPLGDPRCARPAIEIMDYLAAAARHFVRMLAEPLRDRWTQQLAAAAATVAVRGKPIVVAARIIVPLLRLTGDVWRAVCAREDARVTYQVDARVARSLQRDASAMFPPPAKTRGGLATVHIAMDRISQPWSDGELDSLAAKLGVAVTVGEPLDVNLTMSLSEADLNTLRYSESTTADLQTDRLGLKSNAGPDAIAKLVDAASLAPATYRYAVGALSGYSEQRALRDFLCPLHDTGFPVGSPAWIGLLLPGWAFKSKDDADPGTLSLARLQRQRLMADFIRTTWPKPAPTTRSRALRTTKRRTLG